MTQREGTGVEGVRAKKGGDGEQGPAPRVKGSTLRTDLPHQNVIGSRDRGKLPNSI